MTLSSTKLNNLFPNLENCTAEKNVNKKISNTQDKTAAPQGPAEAWWWESCICDLCFLHVLDQYKFFKFLFFSLLFVPDPSSFFNLKCNLDLRILMLPTAQAEHAEQLLRTECIYENQHTLDDSVVIMCDSAAHHLQGQQQQHVRSSSSTRTTAAHAQHRRNTSIVSRAALTRSSTNLAGLVKVSLLGEADREPAGDE